MCVDDSTSVPVPVLFGPDESPFVVFTDNINPSDLMGARYKFGQLQNHKTV